MSVKLVSDHGESAETARKEYVSEVFEFLDIIDKSKMGDLLDVRSRILRLLKFLERTELCGITLRRLNLHFGQACHKRNSRVIDIMINLASEGLIKTDRVKIGRVKNTIFWSSSIDRTINESVEHMKSDDFDGWMAERVRMLDEMKARSIEAG